MTPFLLQNRHMEIQEIKALFSKSLYKEGFDRCNRLLAEQTSNYEEILRARAYGYARSKDYENAVLDYERLIRSPGCTISDYYLAGYHALFIEDYDRATEWLNVVLNCADESQDNWFTSAAYFYLSFTQMKLGAFDEALISLDRLSEIKVDGGLPLPNGQWCTYVQLRKEINRQMADR